MSSVTNVSVGQALHALKAASTKDTIEQEGKLALQQIQSVATNQVEMNTNKPEPTERLGSQININV